MPVCNCQGQGRSFGAGDYTRHYILLYDEGLQTLVKYQGHSPLLSALGPGFCKNRAWLLSYMCFFGRLVSNNLILN